MAMYRPPLDFPFLENLEVPPEWDAAARGFLKVGGVAMVLGAPDSGKSTLSRYLIYRAYAAGKPAALVDLDLGQSHLGPPATLGLGLFPPRAPGDDSLFPEALYFIGQTSPKGALLEVAAGSRVLVDEAARRGVRRVVVNTSGYVEGPGAVRLKLAQVELLRPSLLLALERRGELTALLQALAPPGGKRLLRLPVSSRAKDKTPQERRRYREERFRRYFARAQSLNLPREALTWLGLPLSQGRPLTVAELVEIGQSLGIRPRAGESQGRGLMLFLEEPPAGHLILPPDLGKTWDAVRWLTLMALNLRLVGLLDGRRRTLGLALLRAETWDPDEVSFWTPLPKADASRVCYVKVGPMRLSLEGQELDYV